MSIKSHLMTEEELTAALSRLSPAELSSAADRIRVLSYDPASGRLLSFDGSVDSLAILSRECRTKDRIRALDEETVLDKGRRYTQDYSRNGVWFAYDDGERELFFGPRDSSYQIAKGRIPSAFMADLFSCLGIGEICCDYFSPMRDIYLASMLNTVEPEPDGLFVFMLREEKEDSSICRPFAAARAARHPDSFMYKDPAHETLLQKEQRYRAFYDRAADHAIRVLIRDVGVEPAQDLDSRREELYRYLRGDAAGYSGLVEAIHINPSRLMVMSPTVRSKNKRLFLLLDPWTIDRNILSEDDTKRIYLSDIPCRGDSLADEIRNNGFLLDITFGGKRYLLVPEGRFVNSLCNRLGCGKLAFSGASPRGGHARCAYLAALLSNSSDLQISFSVLPVWAHKKYTLCRAFKASACGNLPKYTLLDAYTHIRWYLHERNIHFRSSRIDNVSDVTVDFVLCDGRGDPVTVPDIGKRVEVGIELQMSESSGYAYRLCGVFFYGDSVFYAGAPTDNMKKRCGRSIIHSKRKTASTSLISNLLSGFFSGAERSDAGKKTYFPAPFDYLMEQAGLFEGGERSLLIGQSPRGDYTGSVFRVLEDLRVGDTAEELMRFADPEYEPECDIGRRAGRKKISARARECHGGGTMLDVFLALCSLSNDGLSAPNYRHELMTSMGSYLAKYGYRALP